VLFDLHGGIYLALLTLGIICVLAAKERDREARQAFQRGECVATFPLQPRPPFRPTLQPTPSMAHDELRYREATGVVGPWVNLVPFVDVDGKTKMRRKFQGEGPEPRHP
jgi:hypothetical protein